LEINIGRISIIMGTVMGAAGFTFPGVEKEFDPYFIMFLLLMSAGSLNMFSIYRQGMLWYSLPSVLVGIIALLSRADVMKMVAVVGLLLALSEIYRLVRTSGQMTEAALISEEEKKYC
jgi:hypothetical protein